MNQYEYTRTWLERDGTRGKDGNGSLTSVDTFRYQTDRFANIFEEKVIEEKGRRVNKHLKYYDKLNRVTRLEMFDENNRLIGFYIHKYQSGHKLVNRKFFVGNK